jgi:hypothetical protein
VWFGTPGELLKTWLIKIMLLAEVFSRKKITEEENLLIWDLRTGDEKTIYPGIS